MPSRSVSVRSIGLSLSRMSHLGWIDSFVLAPAYSHCYQTGFGSDCVEHFSLWKVNVVNTNWQFTSLLRICLCAHNEYARCHMSYQRVERIASSRGDLNCASASGACCQQGWRPQWKADEVKNYFMFRVRRFPLNHFRHFKNFSKINITVITAFISFPQLPANFPQIKSKVLTAETDKGQKE